jgi:cobalt/nickel transport protein
MKYRYYVVLAVALPSFLLAYMISLGYTPWVSAFLKLPSEMEILLFTVQAGLGAATIGHFFGYQKAKRSKKNYASSLESKGGSLQTAIHKQKKRKLISFKNIALFVAMLAIFIIPFIINPNANFSGTDGQGPEAIEGQGYIPWITPLLGELSHTEEILLFSLQIGIGGAIIGYFVGHERGKKARDEDSIRLNMRD